MAGETVYVKSTNSAFKNPDFAAHISRENASLFIAGMATDACVTATARDARDIGYSVSVVADACATFDRQDINGELVEADLVDRVALASLQASGIRLVCTEEAILLARRGGNPGGT